MYDQYFYTYHQPDGNRIIEGEGAFPNVRAIDIPLNGKPAWVVGFAMETIIWHIVLENGDLEIVEVNPAGEIEQMIREEGWFAPMQPPLVGVSPTEGAYVFRSNRAVSPLSHPIPLGDVDLLYIGSNRDVVLAQEAGQMSRLALNALIDGRLVVNSRGQIALYANGTNQRYVHGIMGDDIEGSALVVLQVENGVLRESARIDLPDSDVFEGLAPIWADVNEDGIEDLITTVSNGQMGAQIRVYFFDGTTFTGSANSAAIGQGNRWRHQLAFGAFGPKGENELVDMRTPHIGGTAEYFRFNGKELEIVESFQADITTHAIGSRNLDMAVAGDFNGDGQLEIAVLNQQRNQIIGIQRTEQGAEVVWTVDADGEILTNISAVTLPNGDLALATGTSNSQLRIWIP